MCPPPRLYNATYRGIVRREGGGHRGGGSGGCIRRAHGHYRESAHGHRVHGGQKVCKIERRERERMQNAVPNPNPGRFLLRSLRFFYSHRFDRGICCGVCTASRLSMRDMPVYSWISVIIIVSFYRATMILPEGASTNLKESTRHGWIYK